MAFTVFHTGDTASATEVMNNFYHIFQGDRLPRGGANLEPTTGVYDIGSSAYRWNNVFCESIIGDTINSTNHQIFRKITSVDIGQSATSYDITGLNNAISRIYYLDIKLQSSVSETSGASYIKLGINNDSTQSYGYRLKFGATGYTISSIAQSIFLSQMAVTTSAYCGISVILYSTPGFATVGEVMFFKFSISSSIVPSSYFGGFFTWKGTATLSSIQIEMPFACAAGSTIDIYGIS